MRTSKRAGQGVVRGVSAVLVAAVSGCGAQPPGDVCAKLRAAHWTITDEFTPGLGGKGHVDVYLGEETGPGFTDSPWYTTLQGATLDIT
jgi:hypothetical protein